MDFFKLLFHICPVLLADLSSKFNWTRSALLPWNHKLTCCLQQWIYGSINKKKKLWFYKSRTAKITISFDFLEYFMIYAYEILLYKYTVYTDRSWRSIQVGLKVWQNEMVTFVLMPCPISTPPWQMCTLPSPWLMYTETVWQNLSQNMGYLLGITWKPRFFQRLV